MKKWVLFLVIALGIVVGLGSFQTTDLIGHKEKAADSPFALALEQPSGVGSAFPSDRAQIVAYIKLSQSIDLNQAGKALYQLEDAGDNYLIGYVYVDQKITDPDYCSDCKYGSSKIHVYIDTTGWIVTYLERTEPVGAVIYWTNVDLDYPAITETTLSMAIKAVCDQIGVNYDTIKGNIKYYDFEYPQAAKMLIAINTLPDGGSENVHLEIPSTYSLYRAGYSLIRYTDLYVDENMVEYTPSWKTYTAGDFDLENVLTKGTGHTITFKGEYGGGIVLIYSEG